MKVGNHGSEKVKKFDFFLFIFNKFRSFFINKII